MIGLYYYLEHRPIALPLLNVSAEATIKELAAQVKLTQTYGNDADIPIEAVYAFPVPARAAVCSFVMIKHDGTRVAGLVQEKEEARETYNTAIAQGRQASLMEQQTPDVFQVAVGNIPAKEQVKIELVYATELSEDEENDSVRFHLPVHIGTRYGQPPTSLFASASPKMSFIDIAVSVESIASIAKIDCPSHSLSHSVSMELGPDPTLPNFKDLPFSNYARVWLSSNSPLDKDFVLTIKSAGLDAPRCVAELHPDPSHETVAIALTFVPRFKLPDLARQEFIFLVDRSGSMDGARIAAARNALVVMLRSLPHKDSLFQIMSFGSDAAALWPEGSKAYNQESLGEGTRHVDGMEADYGGTEMRSALQACFAGRNLERPTNVFVLTDGEAWDLDAVLGEVRTAVENAPESAPLRVSVLGIGDTVSTAMCEGIARVGHGVCILVGEQETSFTGKIVRLLKASKTPVISNISVDWGRPPAEVLTVPEGEDDFEMVEEAAGTQKGKPLNVFDESVDPMHVEETQAPPPPSVILPAPPVVQQSPFKIRNLFPGVRLNVYAILQGRTVPKTVILRGSTAEGAEIELPIPVTLSCLQNDPGAPTAIHALAARKIVQDLEDGQHSLRTTLSNPDDTDLLARTVKASIVRLSKTYAISSKHTSFVAVDETTPLPVHTVVQEQQLDSAQTVRSGSRSRALHPAPPPPMAARAPPPPPPGRSAAPPDLSAYNYSVISSLTTDRSAFLCSAPPPPPAPSAFVALARWARTNVASRFLDLEAESCDEVMERDSESDGEDDEEGGAIAKDQSDPVEALARLQSFDGCFSVEVFTFVGLKETDVRALFPTGAADVVVATVLAMAFLSTKLGVEVERDSWEGIYEKAREYVADALAAMGAKESVEWLEAEVAKRLA